LIDIVSPGTLIGDDSVFNAGVYSASADTVSGARLVKIPLSPLTALFRKDPQFCCQLLKYSAMRTLEKDKELEHRTLQETSHRIGCFILSLCVDPQDGPITLSLPYEKVLVAKKLGMRPETLSRALQKLQDDTNVRVEGNAIHVPSVKDLSHYACAHCSYTMTCDKTALG
jgi:CRP-like cAMP-binding protein